MRQNKDVFEVFIYYQKYSKSLTNKGFLTEYRKYGKDQTRLYFVAYCTMRTISRDLFICKRSVLIFKLYIQPFALIIIGYIFNSSFGVIIVQEPEIFENCRKLLFSPFPKGKLGNK